ncbi:DMT family transporter [Tuberibacillus sp. Marseille-P3662]|uniref:DMT family transporter n=1 Tax=Tuberibacillus sp. Marseille-P3662 TaxID=1965358 RepID=UPI000A1CC08A|nr:DMT family transporter [Tuberibacillus sp. Marseille-P3662]
MSKKSPVINPYVVVIIAVLSISTSAILVRVATAPPGIIAFYRLLLTIIIMLPYVLKYRQRFKELHMKTAVLCIIAGIFLGFHFILWFQSLSYTSVASSVVLVTLQPLFAFAGAIMIFKENVRAAGVTGALLAVAGSVIITWGDFTVSGQAFYGDILALTACLLITVYLLIGQAVRTTLSLMTYTFMVYTSSTVTLFLFNFLAQNRFYPYPGLDWLMFLLLAILPMLLGHSLLNWAVKWVGVTTISMSILGEPVGSSILAYIFFDEIIRSQQLIGSLIILIGISIYLKFGTRKHDH